MTPLIVGQHGTGCHPRASGSIADKETETVTAAAAIQIKLFATVAITFGHQAGVGRLRTAVHPGFHEKSRAERRAEIQGDVGHATIVGGQPAETRCGVRVEQLVAWLAEKRLAVEAVVTDSIVMRDRSIRLIQPPVADG